MSADIRITINGEPRPFPAAPTVSELLATLQLAGQRVAVEVNEDLVPRSEHPTHQLCDGDRVEIVRAIGGG